MGLASAALTGALRDIALLAAREILDVYGSDFAVTDKADATPVTEADIRAERVILDGLAECVAQTLEHDRNLSAPDEKGPGGAPPGPPPVPASRPLS